MHVRGARKIPTNLICWPWLLLRHEWNSSASLSARKGNYAQKQNSKWGGKSSSSAAGLASIRPRRFAATTKASPLLISVAFHLCDAKQSLCAGSPRAKERERKRDGTVSGRIQHWAFPPVDSWGPFSAATQVHINANWHWASSTLSLGRVACVTSTNPPAVLIIRPVLWQNVVFPNAARIICSKKRCAAKTGKCKSLSWVRECLYNVALLCRNYAQRLLVKSKYRNKY